jgi:sulfopyruvate decarboxylase TPP-binding subunit
MTNFVQNIDAAKDLCDELIAAGFTPFVHTRSDTFSALHEALDDRVGLLVVPRDDNAIAIAAGVSLAGGCPAVLLSDSGINSCTDAIASLVAPHRTPLLLVVSLGDDATTEGRPTPRRLAELLMGELGVQCVTIEPTEGMAAPVRLVRDIVREELRPAALLVPLDSDGWEI